MFRKLVLIALIAAPANGASGSIIDGGRGSKQLRWPSRIIKIFVSTSLFKPNGAIKADSDVNGAIVRSLQHWEDVADIEFQLAFTDVTSISPAGAVGDGMSVITASPDAENVLAFNRESQNSSGLTRVFFDQRNQISEADIVLSPTQQFTTDKTPGTFDLESVLTHEIGHLLGLSHSPDASAVMFDGVPRNGNLDAFGFTGSLSADDRSKIRDIYGYEPAYSGLRFAIGGSIGDSGNSTSRYLIWAQDTQSGAVIEAKIVNQNRSFRFGGLSVGRYEVVAQELVSERAGSAAISYGSKELQSDMNIALRRVAKPTVFDIRFVGLNGQLTKRAVNVEAGNGYRLVIAGPGLNLSDLRFGATSKGISFEAIDSETTVFENSMPVLAFRLAVANWVRPAQYSIFAEDGNGSRRYFVGAIAVN